MEFLNILRRARMSLPPRIDKATAMLISMALTAGTFNSAHAQEQAQEYALKAALLSKFGLYVEWPGSAFSSPASPINLCIAGEDPFGESLDKVATGELINNRKIVILRLKTIERNSGCHILYIGDSDAQRVEQIIEAVRGGNVLTVTDDDGSGSGTGIIEFVIKDNRVRFNIDDEAAAQNGLVISSKLLSLALNVKRRTIIKGDR